MNFFKLKNKHEFKREREEREAIAFKNAREGKRVLKVVEVSETVDTGKIEDFIKRISNINK